MESLIKKQLQCDSCKEVLHSTCSGLSRIEIQRLKFEKLLSTVKNVQISLKITDLYNVINHLQEKINELNDN